MNYKRKTGKAQRWRLNNTLLKDQWINEEIKKDIRKYFKTNENGNATFKNLWEAANAGLRGKFTVIQASLNKKISNRLTYCLKKQKKNKAESHQKEGNNKDQRRNK